MNRGRESGREGGREREMNFVIAMVSVYRYIHLYSCEAEPNSTHTTPTDGYTHTHNLYTVK